MATAVDDIVALPPFGLRQEEKQRLLVPALCEAWQRAVDSCPEVGRLALRQKWRLDRCQALAEVPFIPVTMFKHFALRCVPEARVVRELRSSSTTGQQPSRIFLDKTTSFRQSRALTRVLADFLGKDRRAYLVLDLPQVASEDLDALTARGAAIRGMSAFASETSYAMQPTGEGDMRLDLAALERFFREAGAANVLLFGFTFMVWKYVVLELERRGLCFSAPGVTLLHSGGWKKLVEERVAKDEFNTRTARVFGCDPHSVLDFYGMVEQVGTVFVDCAAGNKHSPVFADVLIREPRTLAPVAPGEVGILEALSVLPSSYPGNALMTEDLAQLIGVDDCPCGRPGSYFRFVSRVERAELRGCGDTFASRRQPA